MKGLVAQLHEKPHTVAEGGASKRDTDEKAVAPVAAWAPPVGVPSLRGENKEEFLQDCNAWYKSNKGEDIPCKVVEPSCQGGQSALIRFWCKEKLVPWPRLTRRAKATEGRANFGNYISGVPQIEQDQGNAEKGLQAATTVEQTLRPVKEENEFRSRRGAC